MPDRPISEVLSDAGEILQLVELALVEITDFPGRERLAGILNLPVWGRVLTQTLQNLRPLVGSQKFNGWWSPWQAQLKADPDFVYLWDLRNQIEKEGMLGSLRHVTDLWHPSQMQGPSPPNTVGIFIDHGWGAGWRVRKPDGTIELFYAQLPESLGSHLFFTEPTTSQRRPPPKKSIDVIARRYVELLRRIHASALETVGSGG